MVFFMVSQKMNWINFKEDKTLPHALSLELKDTSKSNLSFENHTGYLLSHGSYSKFCSSLLRSFPYGLCPTYLSALLQQYGLQQTLLSSSKLLFTVPTVNSVTHGERAFSFSAPILWNSLPVILLKIQHLFHL